MAAPDICWSSLTPLLEVLPDAIAVYDRDKRMLAANARAKALLELHGGGHRDPWRVGDACLDVLLHRVLEGDEPHIAEQSRFSLPNRLELTLRRVDSPNDGRLAMLTLRPLQAEGVCERHLEHGRTAMIARLLPGIAHEVRGPLTTISGVAQVVSASDEVPDDIRSHLGLVREQVERADQVLRNASTFARGPGSQHFLPVSVHDAIDRCLRLLAYELRAKRIEVVTNLATELPLVDADPEQLLQLVMALALGILDADPEPGAPQTVFVRTRTLLGRRARIEMDRPNARSATLSPDRNPTDDLARALHGEFTPPTDPTHARVSVTLAGSQRHRGYRRGAILAADLDLDQLLECRRQLRAMADSVTLASSPQVAAADVAAGGPRAAVLGLELAEQLNDGLLPQPTVISAPLGREQDARDLARVRGVDWAPKKDAPAMLRRLLTGVEEHDTPYAFPDLGR